MLFAALFFQVESSIQCAALDILPLYNIYNDNTSRNTKLIGAIADATSTRYIFEDINTLLFVV